MGNPEKHRSILSAKASASVQRRVEEITRDAILRIEKMIDSLPRTPESTTKKAAAKKPRELCQLNVTPPSRISSESPASQQSPLSEDETDEEIFYHSDPKKKTEKPTKPKLVDLWDSGLAASESESPPPPKKSNPHNFRFHLDEDIVDSIVEMPLDEKPELSTRSPDKPQPKGKSKENEKKTEENSDSTEDSATNHLDSTLDGQITTVGCSENTKSKSWDRQHLSVTPVIVDSDFSASTRQCPSASSVPKSLRPPIPSTAKSLKKSKSMKSQQSPKEGCGAKKREGRRSLVMSSDCEDCIRPPGPYTVVSRGERFSLATMTLPRLELSSDCKGIRVRFEVNHGAPGERTETRATTIECEMPNFRCERIYVDGRVFVPLKK